MQIRIDQYFKELDFGNMRCKYKAIDLFAGIGGIRLGFQQAFGEELKFVFANEINDFCCQTYLENFGEDPKGDIRKINIKKIPEFDILLAGFPCQAFSIAGRKNGFEDDRGNLFFNIEDILREKQPIAFLLENVKHLEHHDKGRTFSIIKESLIDKLGYNIHYKTLNASEFGLPQNRERIYIVGFKEDLNFKFPEGNKNKVKIEDILETKVNIKYYLSQQYLNSLKKHKARHKAKGHGFGYIVIPPENIANTIVCGGMGKERNLVKDKITYDPWKIGDDPFKKKNNEGIRKMTEREWARLQGFPECFKFPVSMTQTYKQLANSVPVPVIKAIAIQMRVTLDQYYNLKSEEDSLKKVAAQN
ncbi:MAG: DNA (cytosine-5-)-methyltransferase [Promethearchaeota archaeon]